MTSIHRPRFKRVELTAAANGCAVVAPHARERRARSRLEVGPSIGEQHVTHTGDESSGSTGASGGCGCN